MNKNTQILLFTSLFLLLAVLIVSVAVYFIKSAGKSTANSIYKDTKTSIEFSYPTVLEKPVVLKYSVTNKLQTDLQFGDPKGNVSSYLSVSLGNLSNPDYVSIQRGGILDGVGIEKTNENKYENLTITTYKIIEQLSDVDISSDIGKYIVEASYLYDGGNGKPVELAYFRNNKPLTTDELAMVKTNIKLIAKSIKLTNLDNN